jgi:hypothetical protein
MILNGIQSCTRESAHTFALNVIGSLQEATHLRGTAKDTAAALGGERVWAAMVATTILKDLIWEKVRIVVWMVSFMMNRPSKTMVGQMKNADLASQALRLNM